MGGRHLHSDLVFEILLRLPAKPLFRFSCVCKSWCALVSLPIFRDRRPPVLLWCASVQDFHHNVTHHFSSFDSEGSLKKQFVKMVGGHRPFSHSVRGDLILLRDDFDTFLCNHVTQELKILPDIADGCAGFGFGYVESTKEFKVLAIASPFESESDYKVLTVGADQWRDVEDPPFDLAKYDGGGFVKGAIHLRSKHDNRIASFNLEREEWGVLAGPHISSSGHYSLDELSGELCFLDWRMTSTGGMMDIWLLMDYEKGSWINKYSICTRTLNAQSPGAVKPLAIASDGWLLLTVDDYSFRLYDPETKSSRHIHRFKPSDDTYRFHVKCFSSLQHRSIDIAPTNNHIPPRVECISSVIEQSVFMKSAKKMAELVDSSSNTMDERKENSLII